MSNEWIKGCSTALRESLADYLASSTGKPLKAGDVKSCVASRYEDGEQRYYLDFGGADRFVHVTRPQPFWSGTLVWRKGTSASYQANPDMAWHQFFLEPPHRQNTMRHAGGCADLTTSSNVEYFVPADGFGAIWDGAPDGVLPPWDTAEGVEPEPSEVAEPEPAEVAEPDQGPELPVDAGPEPEAEEVVEHDEIHEPDMKADSEPEIVEPDANPEPNPVTEPEDMAEPELAADAPDAVGDSDIADEVVVPSDADGDGMPDEVDTCPLPPEGPIPQEVCNGVDDDCDGSTDEQDMFPKAPLYFACEGSDVGECFPGIQICMDGEFGDCEGITLPVDEACDELDNDCDGQTDEDFASAIGEPCVAGTGVCVASGQWICGPSGKLACSVSPNSDLAAEETCNGLDDNCDGDTDEGTFGDCSVGAGFCLSQGALICTDAALTCNAPVVTPAELGFATFCEYNEAGEGCDATPPLYFNSIFDTATGEEFTADAFLDNSSHKSICFLNNCVEECVEFIPQELWIQGMIMNWDAVSNELGVSLAKVTGTGGNTSLKLVIGGEILYGLKSNGCDSSQYLDCPAQ